MIASSYPRSRCCALVAVLLAWLLPGIVAIADNRPALDAVRAAKIATDYLSRLGPGAPHIVSLTLEKSAIIRGRTSWIARWSRTVENEGDRELGLRVNLDGTSVRLVEDKSNSKRASSNNIRP